MLAAGWHAHTLKAPGKFLISATEHDTPRRARAYLLTDQAVAETASRYADLQPPLDPVSAAVLGASSGHGPADPDDGQDGPDAKGWRGGRRGPADPKLCCVTGLDAMVPHPRLCRPHAWPGRIQRKPQFGGACGDQPSARPCIMDGLVSRQASAIRDQKAGPRLCDRGEGGVKGL
jgi:hypothetical protein